MDSPRNPSRYGWRRDLPDKRDIKRKLIHRATPLPAAVDLRPKMPPVYDQGGVGSCTANAIAAAIDYRRGVEGQPMITPSRLFIYYNERVIEGTTEQDVGAMIRDGIKSVANQGACPEAMWPYDTATFRVPPREDCYKAALLDLVTKYQAVDNTSLDEMRGALADGVPVVLGFSVYESFEGAEVASTGVAPMPNFETEQMLGGHAILVVGYDDASRRFIVRNSWGARWGQGGYFTMPYAYLTDYDLAADGWCVQDVAD